MAKIINTYLLKIYILVFLVLNCKATGSTRHLQGIPVSRVDPFVYLITCAMHAAVFSQSSADDIFCGTAHVAYV